MTFGAFVGVAFAVFVAEYQRLGVSLLEAIDKVMAVGDEPQTAPEKVAEDNAKAMQMLTGMLGGVKGAPVR